MVELVVLAALAFTAMIVIGVLLSVFSMVGWFLWLPFKIVGWMLKLVGLVFALPFILLGCILGGFGLLLGAGVLFLPLFPLILAAAFVWWLVRSRGTSAPSPGGSGPASQARVVS